MTVISTLGERVFSSLARTRRARALHPRGAVALATWTVKEEDSALGAALGTGPRQVRVRLSRGIGVPPPLPDVHGVAVRLEVGAHRVDLLFSGTARHQSTLLPYRDRHGLVWLELERTAEHLFLIGERRVPRRARTVGRLEIGSPAADDGSPYDPYLHEIGVLRPVSFGSRLREAAYRGSRRGRGA